MLTKDQISSFIEKIAEEKFPVQFFCDKDDYAPVSYLRSILLKDCKGYLIFINKCWFNNNKKPQDYFLKAALLHEIGHYKTDTYNIRSGHIKEYKAQVWAIKRAKELKMLKIVEILKRIFREWFEYGWNSDRRIYVMAAKLAEKRGII